jgi:hypothetical protein
MGKKKNSYWNVADFQTYFNVADEIYETLRKKMDQTKSGFSIWEAGLTLADLDKGFVKGAKRWADEHGAPWPPYLPWAEEYALDHRELR